jgi:hypothetical protein
MEVLALAVGVELRYQIPSFALATIDMPAMSIASLLAGTEDGSCFLRRRTA